VSSIGRGDGTQEGEQSSKREVRRGFDGGRDAATTTRGLPSGATPAARALLGAGMGDVAASCAGEEIVFYSVRIGAVSNQRKLIASNRVMVH